jgi:hypothetical protein
MPSSPKVIAQQRLFQGVTEVSRNMVRQGACQFRGVQLGRHEDSSWDACELHRQLQQGQAKMLNADHIALWVAYTSKNIQVLLGKQVHHRLGSCPNIRMTTLEMG